MARFNIFLGLGVAAVGEGVVAGGVAAECYDYATFDDRTGPGPCRIILTDVVRKSVGRSMRTLRKGFVAPKWLICVCMGLLIVGQSYTVATMFVTHHGSSRNWGLFIRFGIPIILYWCMWSGPEKNIKPIYFLLATSCLLYSNSFVFSNHFGLALSMVMAAVLT